MIGNIRSFISSICLNVISLLITLALQRSLQAIIITTARKTYYFTFRLIYSTVQTFSFRCSNTPKPNLIPRLSTLYSREKSVLSVLAILVDGCFYLFTVIQTRNTQGFPSSHLQPTIYYSLINHSLINALTWPALM